MKQNLKKHLCQTDLKSIRMKIIMYSDKKRDKTSLGVKNVKGGAFSNKVELK